jgi:colanic acid/amylovoran biosynthesis glycosyltransferase
MNDDSLLLGFTAPIFRDPYGGLFLERQTISGLKAWRENFSRVVAFSICSDGHAPEGWEKAEVAGIQAPEIEIVPLPDTYSPGIYRRERKRLEALMLRLMRQTQYHTFGYGGWIGDPGEIAARVARRHNIPHAVWFDRVESNVIMSTPAEGLTARLKRRIRSNIVRRNEDRAVRSANLSLLHGASVFAHFSAMARKAALVEDVHYSHADRIGRTAAARKLEDASQGPLRILYCGRASAMKGPLDWIAVLADLKAAGVDFTARWVGDGEMLPEMRKAAGDAGLSEHALCFEGFVSDPELVRNFYREAQVLLFCHLTDESPRNLIESLHSATPLIGYGDPFSSGLVAERQAGILVPRGDSAALVQALIALDRDRTRLVDLIRRASESAGHLTRDNVFHHRSAIIRQQATDS